MTVEFESGAVTGATQNMDTGAENGSTETALKTILKADPKSVPNAGQGADEMGKLHKADPNAGKGEDAVGWFPKIEPKRRQQKPKAPKLKELTAQALICLSEMIADETGKPADRLNAVKTVLDYAGKLPGVDMDTGLKVVFEGIDPSYTE